MDISNFLSIGIVGVILMFLVEVIKAKFPNKPMSSKALIILLSLVVGAGYCVLRETPYFQTVLSMLAAATTVWALLINKNEKPKS